MYDSITSEFFTIAKCSLKFHDFVPQFEQFFLRMINWGVNQITFLKEIKQAMKLDSLSVSSVITNILDHNKNQAQGI